MTEHWYDPFKQALRSGAFVFAHFAVASSFVATNFLIEWGLRRLDDWSKPSAYSEAIMNKLPAWPSLAYVRRLFVLYTVVWLVAGVTALIAICLRFAPSNVAIGMLVAATMIMTILTALRLTRTSIR